MGDLNHFGALITLQKTRSAPFEFLFTHSFAVDYRGLGAAEMAFHVFETMHGIMISAKKEERYDMASTF